MPTISMKRLAGVAVAGAIGAGLAGCGSAGSVATGSGYGSNLMFDTLSGVALIPKKKEPIDYSPRTGLVMPANPNALPTPQETRVVSNPAWPQDASAPGEGALAGLSDEEKRRTLYQRVSGGGKARSNPDLRSDRDIDQATRNAFGRDVQRTREQIAERRNADRGADGTSRRRYLTDPPLTYVAPATATTAEGEVIARQAVTARPKKTGLRRLLPF